MILVMTRRSIGFAIVRRRLDVHEHLRNRLELVRQSIAHEMSDPMPLSPGWLG